MTQAVVFVRMPEEDKQVLKKCAEDKGSNISVFCREAIYRALAELSYLTTDRKKALGIPQK